tara:strand:- start:13464 stop:14009 length:546 start_codon:yes stop_codon:yes gene_type:complete
MQAMTVLLLELAQGSIQPILDPPEIMACVHKLIRWLHSMSSHDGVALRAYNIVCKLLGRHDQTVNHAVPGEGTDQPWMDQSSTAFEMQPGTQVYSEHPGPGESHWDPLLYTTEDYQSGSGNLDSSSNSMGHGTAPGQLPFMHNDLFSTPFDEYVDFSGGFPDFEILDPQQQQQQEHQQHPQ